MEHRTKSIYSGTWSRLLEDGIAATITTRFDTPSSGRFTHPILNIVLYNNVGKTEYERMIDEEERDIFSLLWQNNVSL